MIQAVFDQTPLIVYMTSEKCAQEMALRRYGECKPHVWKEPDKNLPRKRRKERARMLTAMNMRKQRSKER